MNCTEIETAPVKTSEVVSSLIQVHFIYINIKTEYKNDKCIKVWARGRPESMRRAPSLELEMRQGAINEKRHKA